MGQTRDRFTDTSCHSAVVVVVVAGRRRRHYGTIIAVSLTPELMVSC